MEVTDHCVVGFGNHRRVLVEIDRQDSLRGLHTDPMLNRATDSARDVELGCNTLAGLPYLIAMGPPPLIRHYPTTANRSAE